MLSWQFFTRDTHCADEPRSANVRVCCLCLYFPNYVFYVPNPYVLGTRPCKNDHCSKLELVRAEHVSLMVRTVAISLLWVAHGWNLHLIPFVPTVLNKFMFYEYHCVASVSLGLPMQFVHCCLVTPRVFMPTSLTVANSLDGF